MNKLIDKQAFSLNSYKTNKCIVCLSQNFVMIDINAKKNEFDVVYPRLNNCYSMFWSQDNSKILFLNTTGTGFLYDVNSCKIIADKICFGKEFFNQCFVSHKNGYFYLNEKEEIAWFDISTLESKITTFTGKYSFIYDDKDKAFFVSIDECGDYSYYNLLSIKCFSKKSERFEMWSITLPKGDLKLFRKIYSNFYLIVLYEEKNNEIQTEIYLFDLLNKKLLYLFNAMDFLDNESEEYFINFETDKSQKIGYILYSQSLKVIDLTTKTVLHCIPFEGTWDIRLFSDSLIIATLGGVYKLTKSELE